MWLFVEILKVAQLIGTCLHSLDERDIPSKFMVFTPALLYKVLPHAYQNVGVTTVLA